LPGERVALAEGESELSPAPGATVRLLVVAGACVEEKVVLPQPTTTSSAAKAAS
jgi:hypothetical protein